jgi:hypothetical protein
LTLAVRPWRVPWLQIQADDLPAAGGWQQANLTNFLIWQAMIGIGALLLFGTPFLRFEWTPARGIHTTEGGSAELTPAAWAAAAVASRPAGRSRYRRSCRQILRRRRRHQFVETAPDIDIPMKTDEVVGARAVNERIWGCGCKLDVRMRCAPFEPEWNN